MTDEQNIREELKGIKKTLGELKEESTNSLKVKNGFFELELISSGESMDSLINKAEKLKSKFNSKNKNRFPKYMT